LFSGVALSGLKAGGKIILNTTKLYADARIVAVDADKIASGILNRPIANTAMLGALSAVCPDITIAEIEKAIAAALPERQVACNIAVAKAAKGAVG
jgi:pyruvate ferredoxin oxidoreductase gamma subunit